MYRLRPLTMLPRTAWADRPTTMPLMPPAHPQQLLESYLSLPHHTPLSEAKELLYPCSLAGHAAQE